MKQSVIACLIICLSELCISLCLMSTQWMFKNIAVVAGCKDKDTVLEAVMESGLVLMYAHTSMKKDKDVAIAAVHTTHVHGVQAHPGLSLPPGHPRPGAARRGAVWTHSE